MTRAPLLFIGGSGAIGRQAACVLRAARANVPLLIGGRDHAQAQTAAAEVGQTEGIVLDLAAADPGLGERPVGAVALFQMGLR